MRNWLEKMLASPTVAVAVVGIIVGSLALLIRLEVETRHLRDKVDHLQTNMTELQADVNEIKANQLRILDALENIETALGNHVHDNDGKVRITLSSNRQ